MTTPTCFSCRWSHSDVVILRGKVSANLFCKPRGIDTLQIASALCQHYEREAGADEPEGRAA